MRYANARDLAEDIAAGATADVFASASPQHPRRLHELGLAEPARPFATNRLVVAGAAGERAGTVALLAEPGTRVAVEVEGIPLGARILRAAGFDPAGGR